MAAPALSRVPALRDTIESINGLAADGLADIAAIARLALFRLEALKGDTDLKDIAQALRAISDQAAETQDSIDGETEHAGCRLTGMRRVS